MRDHTDSRQLSVCEEVFETRPCPLSDVCVCVFPRLKAALARRTGRSEEELCLEERRRSARVAEEENLSLEEGTPLERGSRRARKEEPKLSDVWDCPYLDPHKRRANVDSVP